jgi:hypothetical protein
VTQQIKSDPVTLLALGSRMGLQGFQPESAKATSEPAKRPSPSLKPPAVANPARLNTNVDASTVMAFARSARLRCVADETGAL